MAKTNIIVPNPDGSGRYCVFDPVAGKYVRGGINVSRGQAEKLVRGVRPVDWESAARSNGWFSPAEVEQRIEAALDTAEQARAAERECDRACGERTSECDCNHGDSGKERAGGSETPPPPVPADGGGFSVDTDL